MIEIAAVNITARVHEFANTAHCLYYSVNDVYIVGDILWWRAYTLAQRLNIRVFIAHAPL